MSPASIASAWCAAACSSVRSPDRTTTDVIPLHEWHSIVRTYDGHFMRIYIDCRQAAHIACGPQKTDLGSPTLIGADLCGYATAHHFEGYISEISLWQRSLDASEVKALANSNPLSSKTLSKDLIGYWCVYQRADAQSKIRNGVRLAGDQQFHGVYLREGTPLLDRWRGWLASGGEALPRPAKPIPGNHMGPLFGGKEGVYMHVTGSASRLSFGGSALFTLAVQFCPQPTAARASAPTAAGAPREANGGGSGPMILLSNSFGIAESSVWASTLSCALLSSRGAAPPAYRRRSPAQPPHALRPAPSTGLLREAGFPPSARLSRRIIIALCNTHSLLQTSPQPP